MNTEDPDTKDRDTKDREFDPYDLVRVKKATDYVLLNVNDSIVTNKDLAELVETALKSRETPWFPPNTVGDQLVLVLVKQG